MQNATKCCWRNDAKSTSSSSSTGGDADGGGGARTKRGRIVDVVIIPTRRRL